MRETISVYGAFISLSVAIACPETPESPHKVL